MDSTRLSITYRPLRIGWAVKSGDREAFRTAVKSNSALWGGGYNPILIADAPEACDALIEEFRLDLILAVSTGPEIDALLLRHKHLIDPFHGRGIFVRGSSDFCYVLDVQNLLHHHQSSHKPIEDTYTIYTWDQSDTLSDVLLATFGQYPDLSSTGIPYLDILRSGVTCTDAAIAKGANLSSDHYRAHTINLLSRSFVEERRSLRQHGSYHGFFVGDSSSLPDLIYFWNLRARAIEVVFVDVREPHRFTDVMNGWNRDLSQMISRNPRQSIEDHNVCAWARREIMETREFLDLQTTYQFTPMSIDESLSADIRERVPMCVIGETTVTAFEADGEDGIRLSFSLSGKPFSEHAYFLNQHLIASLGRIYSGDRNETHTYAPPYIPQLNEYYARSTQIRHDCFRSEPEGNGIVITSTKGELTVKALNIEELVNQMFGLASYRAVPSYAGLASRQLLKHLGGAQGARVLKISGARRLIKQFGPLDPFTKATALKTIGARDPLDPTISFLDYQDLYIEQRPGDTPLTPESVFSFMVERRLYRVGLELNCPSCRMNSWASLETLEHNMTCDLCGHVYNASRKIADNDAFQFRRSGILGAEKNAHGAIPVCLTIQQLDTAFRSGMGTGFFCTSLNLDPINGAQGPCCESDLIWICPDLNSNKVVVIIGECKDAGAINQRDVSNMIAVADAFPPKKFQVYILLSQLTSFTDSQKELAKSINSNGRVRAIMLSQHELEPYHIYDRATSLRDFQKYVSSAQELANVTKILYLS